MKATFALRYCLLVEHLGYSTVELWCDGVYTMTEVVAIDVLSSIEQLDWLVSLKVTARPRSFGGRT